MEENVPWWFRRNIREVCRNVRGVLLDRRLRDRQPLRVLEFRKEIRIRYRSSVRNSERARRLERRGCVAFREEYRLLHTTGVVFRATHR